MRFTVIGLRFGILEHRRWSEGGEPWGGSGFLKWPEMEWFGEGGGDAGGVGVSVVGEAFEDEVAAFDGALRVVQGIEARWCLRQAGE